MTNEIILQTLDLMYDYIRAECGDGDAIWFTESVTQIEPIFKEFVRSYDNGWQYVEEILSDETWVIRFERENESISVTNNLEYFNARPDYITLKIHFV